MKPPSTASFQAFDELVERVKTRLRDRGPATCETLATELGAPRVNVLFALEVLCEGKEKCIVRLQRNEWALITESRKQTFRQG